METAGEQHTRSARRRKESERRNRQVIDAIFKNKKERRTDNSLIIDYNKNKGGCVV